MPTSKEDYSASRLDEAVEVQIFVQLLDIYFSSPNLDTIGNVRNSLLHSVHPFYNVYISAVV